jgi:intracellular sulfur oxidation DsrE/DsrF family protein
MGRVSPNSRSDVSRPRFTSQMYKESIMIRRNLFRLSGIGAMLLLLQGRQALAAPIRMKVAYHLSDADKIGFVLGNIVNHLNAIGESKDADIRLVVHGPALLAFSARSMDVEIEERLVQLRERGLGLEACGNTMKGAGLTLADLATGFIRIEAGGVYRLAELQLAGYAYIRP